MCNKDVTYMKYENSGDAKYNVIIIGATKLCKSGGFNDVASFALTNINNNE